MTSPINDTITAIATATGKAGIAIVRVSGPTSTTIANKIFRTTGEPPSKRPAGTFVHGYIHRAKAATDDADIDEVMLMIFKAPHSYTGEDVIEIQGHGGAISAKRILNAVLDSGARPAEPGEFTKRAFLNGRIDLLQAEAVADLIGAQSDRAASAALEQLEGGLSDVVTSVYDDALAIAGDLEGSLDFGEHELPTAIPAKIKSNINTIRERLKQMLDTWEEGRLMREGAVVVISGQPNVGKSSLLNRLLGTNRAIVATIPGTTRDTIEETLVLAGIPIRLVDTAGLRETTCEIEKEGVSRAKTSIQQADLNIHMLDGSQALNNASKARLTECNPDKTIVVLNKSDLGVVIKNSDLPYNCVITCSCLKTVNIEKLKETLVNKLNISTATQPHAAISERHRQIIQNALNELNSAAEWLDLNDESTLVLAAAGLRNALTELGALTGRVYTEELLDNVFGRFCVGK
ncbi:MAG: tRNA uridine-5-carboxymethylaminomethyl(34) synthesis GTPase MnmE [Kiritimatiellae bacterium]|nr:tRNA uridine-5-carboxymethylaminomethyl(34) synthesis GTPase MnmE [Kiritimatiellia bacterium]